LDFFLITAGLGVPPLVADDFLAATPSVLSAVGVATSDFFAVAESGFLACAFSSSEATG
jgi:hypothetical protein